MVGKILLKRTVVGWEDDDDEALDRQDIIDESRRQIEADGLESVRDTATNKLITNAPRFQQLLLWISLIFPINIDDISTDQIQNPTIETVSPTASVKQMVTYSATKELFGISLYRTEYQFLEDSEKSDFWIIQDTYYSTPLHLVFTLMPLCYLPALVGIPIVRQFPIVAIGRIIIWATIIFGSIGLLISLVGSIIHTSLKPPELEYESVSAYYEQEHNLGFQRWSISPLLLLAIMVANYNVPIFAIIIPVIIIIVLSLYWTLGPLRWQFSSSHYNQFTRPLSSVKLQLMVQVVIVVFLAVLSLGTTGSIFGFRPPRIVQVAIGRYTSLFSVMILFSVISLAWVSINENWVRERRRTELSIQSGTTSNASVNWSHVTYTLLSSSLSVLIVGLIISLLSPLRTHINLIVLNPLSINWFIETIAIIFTISFGLVFFGIIGPVQVLKYRKSIKAEPFDSPISAFVDPDVYQRTDGGETQSRPDGIYLSKTYISVLTDDELKAVLAHEAAHSQEYADSWLSYYAPLLATLLLTTRSTLLIALDFNQREYRADAYAVDQLQSEGVDPRALIRVLEKFRDGELKPVAGATKTAGSPPFLTSVSLENEFHMRGEDGGQQSDQPHWKEQLQSIIEVFVGAFAVVDAHPEPDARIEQIEKKLDS